MSQELELFVYDFLRDNREEQFVILLFPMMLEYILILREFVGLEFDKNPQMVDLLAGFF